MVRNQFTFVVVQNATNWPRTAGLSKNTSEFIHFLAFSWSLTLQRNNLSLKTYLYKFGKSLRSALLVVSYLEEVARSPLPYFGTQPSGNQVLWVFDSTCLQIFFNKFHNFHLTLALVNLQLNSDKSFIH